MVLAMVVGRSFIVDVATDAADVDSSLSPAAVVDSSSVVEAASVVGASVASTGSTAACDSIIC